MIPVLRAASAGALAAAVVLASAPATAQSSAGHGADHHPRTDAPLAAFHELMEPLWHEPPGAAVNARACGVAAEIVSGARATALRPSPDHAALITSAQSLQRACAVHDEAAVGAELVRLHALFHRLAGGGRS